MSTPNTPYHPIDCNFYDVLLDRATRKHPAQIQYLTADGPHTLEAIIMDVYTQNKAEFMQLDNGLHIRLDQLIAVDGIPLPEGGQCGF